MIKTRGGEGLAVNYRSERIFSNKQRVGFERVCGFPQAEGWVRMVIILMLQAKNRSVLLVTLPFSCIHYWPFSLQEMRGMGIWEHKWQGILWSGLWSYYMTSDL